MNNVDLNRYQGKWFEIGSFPLRAQKNCSCTFAEYRLKENGIVEVYNQCIDKETQKIKSIKGTAKSVDPTNARLKVKFFRLFSSPYQILYVDKEYQVALVGTPNRDYLWILSRTPELREENTRQLLEIASARGFDLSRFKFTTQTNCE